MKNRIALFIAAFFIWMLLGWPPDAQHALVGLPVAALVVFLAGDVFSGRPQHYFQIKRYFYFVYFIGLAFWGLLKANIDMIFRLTNPRLRLNSGIIKVKTKLRSDLGKTFLANALTFSTEALCVDINGEAGILYLHWLDIRPQDNEKIAQLAADKFEKILTRVFE